MKKLLYLLLFFPLGLFGQTQIIGVGASANDGTGDPLRTAMQKINLNTLAIQDSFGNIYREVQTRNVIHDSIQARIDAALELSDYIDDALYDQTRIFNILDYGATEGGTVEDATAIQAAINAAVAYDVTGFTGATVYIPAGYWYITKPDTLRSNITILCEEGAEFEFPNAYSGAMCVNDSTEALVHAWVKGGRFICPTRTYTYAKLYSSQWANYILDVHFENSWIEAANIGFDIQTFGTGWINGNVFDNLFIWGAQSSAIKTRQNVVGSGINGNLFSNVQIQSIVGSDFSVDSLSGDYNMFSNLMIWDDDQNDYGFIISNDAQFNTIIASGISAAKFDDVASDHRNFVMNSGSIISGIEIFEADNDTTNLGNDNFLMTSGKLLYPKQVVIHASTVPDSLDRLIASHNGAAGTTAAPAGDVAIKLKSYAPYPYSYKSANYSARLLSRNVAVNNYGSYLYLQTHGTADSENYVTGLTLDQYGGISYLLTNSGGVGNGLAVDALTRFLYYNEAGASDLTDNPQIVAGRDGQIITIIGSSDVNTLTLDDGTGLLLSAQCVLGAGDTITLVYITALSGWVETARSNN